MPLVIDQKTCWKWTLFSLTTASVIAASFVMTLAVPQTKSRLFDVAAVEGPSSLNSMLFSPDLGLPYRVEFSLDVAS
jgi:hypothetical protein